MRAAFPPDANLTERFRQTQIVRLHRAEVISQDQSQAEDGWMLDRPQLNPAP
jgi:hypothetical protein